MHSLTNNIHLLTLQDQQLLESAKIVAPTTAPLIPDVIATVLRPISTLSMILSVFLYFLYKASLC